MGLVDLAYELYAVSRSAGKPLELVETVGFNGNALWGFKVCRLFAEECYCCQMSRFGVHIL